MVDDEETVKARSGIGTGEDLSNLSVEELERRIAAFRAEIVRHEAEVAAKQSSKHAAESFFKQD